MTDVFEMPNNAENYYRKALNLIEAKRYIEAAELLKKSFLIEPNFHVFEELVQIYLSFALNEELKDIWEILDLDTDQILEDSALTQLYGLCVPILFDQQLAIIELYRIKEVSHSRQWPTEHLSRSIAELNDQHLFEKTLSKASSPEAIQQLIDHLVKKGSHELSLRIKQLIQMPIEDTDTLLRALLVHPEIFQYLKSNILHNLIKQELTGTYLLSWFGETSSVTIEELKQFDQYPIYDQTISCIQEYCDSHNPHLFEQICQQFVMHSMIYFPYLENVITSGQAWLDIFLVQNGLEDERNASSLNQELLTYYSVANDELLKLYSGRQN